MALIYLPASSAPQNWKYVHKFAFLSAPILLCFVIDNFLGQEKASAQGVVRNIWGWTWKTTEKLKQEFCLKSAPTSKPLSSYWLQRAFSDLVVNRQGTFLKTTKSVYVDIIFFWKLPEVEPCKVFLKSCPKQFPSLGGNGVQKEQRGRHQNVLFLLAWQTESNGVDQWFSGCCLWTSSFSTSCELISMDEKGATH